MFFFSAIGILPLFLPLSPLFPSLSLSTPLTLINSRRKSSQNLDAKVQTAILNKQVNGLLPITSNVFFDIF